MNAILTSRERMGRRGGPSKEGPTKSVRMYEEEAAFVYWIGEATGLSQAAVLRIVGRPSLVALYERHRPAIERLKAMRAEEEMMRDEQRKMVEEPLLNHPRPAPGAADDAPASPPAATPETKPQKRRRGG